jgi:hypothetical protein
MLIITAGLAVTGNAQVMVHSPEEVTNNKPAEIKKQYDEDALTWYAVYADDKAIHVYVSITDSLQKRKVLQNGMELWIDSKGKKNKITGIMFPLSTKTNTYPGGGNRNAAGGPPPFSQNSTNNNIKNADSDMQQLIKSQTELEVKGLTGIADGKQTIAQLTGLSVQLRMLHDTLVYQATIPFKSIERPAKNIVSIGIIEKGIAIPDFGGDMGGPGDDFGGPPPGDVGGMMPPGDGPPGDFDMRRLYETNSIWYKLKLKN